MEYLADTVAIVRYFSKSGKIGKRALKILKDADAGEHEIYVSIISIVEIMYLTEKNRIPLRLEETLSTIAISDNYHIVDLDVDTIQNANTIHGLELHDRLIVASAKQLNLPILTNDTVIVKSNLVEVL